MQKMQPTNKDELWLDMYTIHQVHVASMHSLEFWERALRAQKARVDMSIFQLHSQTHSILIRASPCRPHVCMQLV